MLRLFESRFDFFNCCNAALISRQLGKTAVKMVLLTIKHRCSEKTGKLVLITDGPKMLFGLLAKEVFRVNSVRWVILMPCKSVKELEIQWRSIARSRQDSESPFTMWFTFSIQKPFNSSANSASDPNSFARTIEDRARVKSERFLGFFILTQQLKQNTKLRFLADTREGISSEQRTLFAENFEISQPYVSNVSVESALNHRKDTFVS